MSYYCTYLTCGAHLGPDKMRTDCSIGIAMLLTDDVAVGTQGNKKDPTSHAGKLEDVEPMDSLEGLLVPLYHGSLLQYKEEFVNYGTEKHIS